MAQSPNRLAKIAKTRSNLKAGGHNALYAMFTGSQVAHTDATHHPAKRAVVKTANTATRLAHEYAVAKNWIPRA